MSIGGALWLIIGALTIIIGIDGAKTRRETMEKLDEMHVDLRATIGAILEMMERGKSH